MIVQVKTKKSLIIDCPSCNEHEFDITHLVDGKKNHAGPWYCDRCFKGIYFDVSEGGVVECEITDKTSEPTYAFLRYGSLLLVVHGICHDGDLDHEHHESYYEEHSCPTNYLHDVLMVVDLVSGDTDPHGLFDYLGSSKIPRWPGTSNPVDDEDTGIIRAMIPLLESGFKNQPWFKSLKEMY